MVELTTEDREQISNQIVEYQKNQLTTPLESVSILLTPDGQQANEALDKAMQSQAKPDPKEGRRIKNKIKKIWHKWRTATLDTKSLEVEKIACQIKIERAKTQQALAKIRREEKLLKVQHWLTLNKGNLEDIDANTVSKPNMFWYGLRRGCYHFTKLTNNIPKIVKNLFMIGAIVLSLILLKGLNVL